MNVMRTWSFKGEREGKEWLTDQDSMSKRVHEVSHRWRPSCGTGEGIPSLTVARGKGVEGVSGGLSLLMVFSVNRESRCNYLKTCVVSLLLNTVRSW